MGEENLFNLKTQNVNLKMIEEGAYGQKKRLRPRRRENRLDCKNIRRNNSTNFPKFDKRYGCRFKKLDKSPK